MFSVNDHPLRLVEPEIGLSLLIEILLGANDFLLAEQVVLDSPVDFPLLFPDFEEFLHPQKLEGRSLLYLVHEALHELEASFRLSLLVFQLEETGSEVFDLHFEVLHSENSPEVFRFFHY